MKGFLNTQTVNFSSMKKSVSQINISKFQSIQLSLGGSNDYKYDRGFDISPAPIDRNISKGNLRITLPSISENNHDAGLDVSHSYTIQYHNNPVAMDPQYSSPLYKQKKKNQQISITDKVTEAQND